MIRYGCRIGVLFAAMLAGPALLTAFPQDETPAVVLDVTVTAAGRTVPDLKAGDFDVRHDGERHKILEASYVDARRQREPEGRRIVLLVDDLNLTPEDAANVRGALRQFIDELMLPGDQAAVMLSSSGATSRLNPTSDKPVLRAAAGAIQPVPSWDASAVRSRRLFPTGTLGAVELALTCLSDIPGRKILVLFSGAPALYGPFPRRMSSLLGRANLSFTVFYVVDLLGSAAHIPAAPRTASGGSEGEPESDLARLARDTGGGVLDNVTPSAALGRILAEQEGYYLLRLDSEYPPVVKVARPGAQVRSRRTPSGRLDLLTPGLLRALWTSAGNLHTKLTLGFTDSNEGTSLAGLLYVEGRDFGFTRTREGLYRYTFDVGATISGEDGLALDRGTRVIDGQLNEEEYRQAVREGLILPLRIPAPPPACHIRVGFRDGTSGRFGLSYQYADVPNHRSGDLGLSGVLLSGQQRELVVIGKPLRALPDGPALRIFQAGDALAYTVEIYHLLADGESRGRMECRIRVLQDGREVFSKPPVPVSVDMAGVESRTITGRFTLPADFQPGRYWLELTVVDRLSKEKPRTASAYTDFEVKGQK